MMRLARQSTIILVLAFVWTFGFCATAWGVKFAGGTGQPNDPYKIATAAQLLAIDGDWTLLDKHFVLIATIDLSGKKWSGPVISSFYGSFDGNGHTIENLGTEDKKSQGLFGHITTTGEVRNLGIVNAHVESSGGRTGILAGRNSGAVRNCYSTGTVVNNSTSAGGLVGYNYGTVSNSYSTAAVSGRSQVGGLVGANSGLHNGSLIQCYSTGEVTGNNAVGGLVGMNQSRFSSCFSTSTVTGKASVGGLAGINSGLIASCYASGTLVSTGTYAYSIGGLVGDNTSDARIITSYSAVQFRIATNDPPVVGRLVGAGGIDENCRDCYFLDPNDGSEWDNGVGTGLTSEEMTLQVSFSGWNFWGTTQDGWNDPWFMPQNAYPVLTWQADVTGLHRIPDVAGLTIEKAQAALTEAGFVPGEVSYDFDSAVSEGCVIRAEPFSLALAGATVDLIASSGGTGNWADNPGDGTAENPYQIATAGQLDVLGADPTLWDKHFVLTADLDLVGRTYTTAVVAPDSNNATEGFQGTPFSGTFDGRGHVIRNLTIAPILQIQYEYVGLFGMVAQSGRIRDLNVLDADVSTTGNRIVTVGVLVGYNAGTVEQCSATGILSGGCGGGIIGSNSGTWAHCTADLIRL